MAAWTRDIAPDIASNQISEQPGRLVVIVMDRSRSIVDIVATAGGQTSRRAMRFRLQ